jgi:hypothetical protein
VPMVCAMSNTCALRSLPACSRRSKNGQKPSTRFAEDPKFQIRDECRGWQRASAIDFLALGVARLILPLAEAGRRTRRMRPRRVAHTWHRRFEDPTGRAGCRRAQVESSPWRRRGNLTANVHHLNTGSEYPIESVACGGSGVWTLGGQAHMPAPADVFNANSACCASSSAILWLATTNCAFTDAAPAQAGGGTAGSLTTGPFTTGAPWPNPLRMRSTRGFFRRLRLCRGSFLAALHRQTLIPAI